MRKSKMFPLKNGRVTRMSFSNKEDVLEMPDLMEIQRNSYRWFIEEGLKEIFEDVSPIEDHSGNISLEFLSYKVLEDKKKYSIEECKERDVTYYAPMYAKCRLTRKEPFASIDVDVNMGDIPIMTPTGTFVINGAERVIVSQLVRSPGVYYDIAHDKYGKKLYSSTVIPNRGAWLEYETDSNDLFYGKIDRQKKVPITVIIRAMGVSTNKDITDLFGEEPKIMATLQEDKSSNTAEALLTIYNKLRPGEPAVVENAENLIYGMFFDTRRYNTDRVGRYKYNKKLHLRERVVGGKVAEPIVDINTGELLCDEGEILTKELCEKIQNTGIPSISVYPRIDMGDENHKVKILSNRMVDITEYIDIDPKEVGVNEPVYYPELMRILSESSGDIDELKEEISKSIRLLIPKSVTKEDILVSINYIINMEYGFGERDDIDHLGNRRIRAVGELLANQYRVGVGRMERGIKDKMITVSIDDLFRGADDEQKKGIGTLVNVKPVTASLKEFFGSSQLSQFMDQNNLLSEITHKRRLSALGPGGLSRERSGFEVRDVHYTHYGRMCPIETPEGPNIGLINSLASYARINEYGFIEAPYRIIKKDKKGIPVVTKEVEYMTADMEDNFHVAQANEPLDEEGHFINTKVSGRYREETQEYEPDQFEYMDVSPKMVFSVATSLIPFLQNDDANRALMGSNMQRQAVPLMVTEAPVIGTGMEEKAAVDSGVCVICEKTGTVDSVDSRQIVIKEEDGNKKIYRLQKFSRSNQSNCYNQRPIVFKGDKVEKGEVIADGASTKNGEIALGKNPLIGFMTWEGYNYEDAVLISERLVQDDVYTSIHIEEYEITSRDTKLGYEEITNDIPGISEEARKNLDEHGVIRIGAEVRAGDILVGKVTPKGETEQSGEYKLLQAIFGNKAGEVRDTSLRLPHGAYGIVVDTKVFTRENNDELAPGELECIRVYIAQKRKISVGDKMAGRHGNKGVVSRVLPVEDMPFLPNGRPLDIVLNPLGVPSRMNIGQVLEIHLSLAAKALGFDITTPVFDGAKEEDIGDALEMANDYVNTDFKEFKKKYKDSLDGGVLKYLEENQEHKKLWEGVPLKRDGKVRLRDGRTGEEFDGEVTIGHMHYLKLHHLVDDKMHARSIGPYALVTQQPLGGKAQFGGQRFGEMEVWALEAYGAAYTLQEILTVKSDDITGRVKTYESIVKGENIPKPSTPESFKVLLKEMQSLGLDVKVLGDNLEEIDIRETVDMGDVNIHSFLNNERDIEVSDSRGLSELGFREIEVGEDDFIDVEDSDFYEEGDYVDDSYGDGNEEM